MLASARLRRALWPLCLVALGSSGLTCGRSPEPANQTSLAQSALASVVTPSLPPPSAEPQALSSAAPPSDTCALPAHLLARGWPRTLTPTSAVRPDTSEPASAPADTAFTLGVLPDTQYYASCRSAHFATQSNWLAAHAETLSLAAAVHVGDITEHNTPEEWEFARAALEPLRERLPTFLATGNHDYGDGGSANRRQTWFPRYFGALPPATAPTLAESLDPANPENAYYRLSFPAGKVSAAPFTLGVLVLEWSPRRSSVTWADEVLTKYPRDRVVFVTHAYLYYDSTRYDWANKGQAQEWNPHAYGDDRPEDKQPADVFDGEKLWNTLLAKHGNVFATLHGHVLGDGTGLLSSRGTHGNVVHQMLSNYQMLDEGGLGYLRLLEFARDGETLRVRTFSPSLKVWATAEDQHFDLKITPPLW